MKYLITLSLFFFITTFVFAQTPINDSVPVPGQWSKQKINQWYTDQPWLVGCNYYPASAINQIEMWQASTWDLERIDLELSWAESIGMNTVRVYLHDLVWEDDEKGLYARMDEFMNICQKHSIKAMFVFFDDCHFPNPKLGEQPLPVKGYHNSGWVNSPAREVAVRYAQGKASKKEKKRLKGYIQKTMERFKEDNRVLMWELYNEPGRGNGADGDMTTTAVKSMGDASNQLLYDAWVWAREVNPTQPITSSTFGCVEDRNIKINRINSDLQSIHPYGTPEITKEVIEDYQTTGRPVLCTEWLARERGSTVEDCLPLMKEMNVGAINWGFVTAKTGTCWPWKSRKTKDGQKRDIDKERKEGNTVKDGEEFPKPDLWFHDLFYIDGTPYDPKEIELFKKLTGKK